MICAPQVQPDLESFTAPYFFFSNNQDSEILFVSKSIEDVLGYRAKDVVGRKYTEFLDPNSPLNSDISEFKRRRFSGDGHHEHLRVVESRDGKLKVLKVQTYGGKDEEGNVVANYGLVQDVTEIYFAEDELHQKLEHLRKIDESLSVREREVLERVLAGNLNKSIAKQFSITERAVERTRARLMSKFESETTAEMVSKATELRMLKSVILLAKNSRPFAKAMFRDKN